MRFYRIDLTDTDLDGRGFVELAQRVAAYGGVMAARIEAEREQSTPASPPTAAQPQQRGSGPERVELAAFRMQFPGVVSVTRAAE